MKLWIIPDVNFGKHSVQELFLILPNKSGVDISKYTFEWIGFH